MAEDVLRFDRNGVGRYVAAGVGNYTIEFMIFSAIAGVGVNVGLERSGLSAFIEVFLVRDRLKGSRTNLLVPLIAQVLAASANGVCGVAVNGLSRHIRPFDGARLARVVRGLHDDVGCSVGGNLHVGHGNDAHLGFAHSAVELCRSVALGGGIGLGDDFEVALAVAGFLHGTSAVAAQLPVGVAVAAPGRSNVGVVAVLLVVAELQTLVVFVAPVFHEFRTLHTELVVAAHGLGVGFAAVGTELAVVAAVAVVAVAALFADEVVAVVKFVAFGAEVVVAVLLAVGAAAAIIAELVNFAAAAAGVAEVIVPVATLGAELVLAVVVALAVGAIAAVVAFAILRTLAAAGAEVIHKVARLYAEAVRAVHFIPFLVAALLAEAAVVAEVDAFAFSTFATFFAIPAVVLAAVDAVVATALAPLYFLSGEAVVTLRTVVPAVLALITFSAEVAVLTTVAKATVHAVFAGCIPITIVEGAKHMVVATQFYLGIGQFEMCSAFRASFSAAILTVRNEHVNLAVALGHFNLKQLVAEGAT